jgi:hypothetical protein
MSDEFDSVRVVPKRAAIKLCNLSERTWERLPDPPPTRWRRRSTKFYATWKSN